MLQTAIGRSGPARHFLPCRYYFMPGSESWNICSLRRFITYSRCIFTGFRTDLSKGPYLLSFLYVTFLFPLPCVFAGIFGLVASLLSISKQSNQEYKNIDVSKLTPLFSSAQGNVRLGSVPSGSVIPLATVRNVKKTTVNFIADRKKQGF